MVNVVVCFIHGEPIAFQLPSLHTLYRDCKKLYRWLLDEAIAEAVNGDDVLRFRRIRFDFLSQPGDMVIDRTRNRAAFIAPNLIQQLIACDDLTLMTNQITQDLKFAR